MKHLKMKLLCLCVVLFSLAGCSGGSSSSNEDNSSPIQTPEASGIWLGDMITVLNTTDSSGNPINRPLGTTFVIGIITQDNEARFIGDDVQYEGDISVTSGTVTFSTEMNKYKWIEALTGYDATSTSLDFWGYVSTRALIFGAYDESGESEDIDHSYVVYYTTTYTIPPNVETLAGEWSIKNAIVAGNTASLTITPDVASTMGAGITGSDTLSNSFSGTITILYDLYNVYRVQMRINGGEMLTGLATYVQEANTNGIELTSGVMAIGVNSSSGDTSFGGLAVKPEP